MKITKGTPQAMEFLDLLKKEGNLVDVYSQEFFDRQPTYDEDPEAPFDKMPWDTLKSLKQIPVKMQNPKTTFFLYI